MNQDIDIISACLYEINDKNYKPFADKREDDFVIVLFENSNEQAFIQCVYNTKLKKVQSYKKMNQREILNILNREEEV